MVYLDQWNLSNTRWRPSHCSEFHGFRFRKAYPALEITNAASEGSGQKAHQPPGPKGMPREWINAVAQREVNFTPPLPALAGNQWSQVKVVMGTPTTAHFCFCLLQKSYSGESRSSAPRSAYTFLADLHCKTNLFNCYLFLGLTFWNPAQPWPVNALNGPNGLKTFRAFAHNRQGWWKLFHLWGTKVENTLFLPHREPVARMGTEYRSSKLQSGILNQNYFLPEYSQCDSALEMPFWKSRQLAHGLLMLKTTDISFWFYGQNFHQNANLREEGHFKWCHENILIKSSGLAWCYIIQLCTPLK